MIKSQYRSRTETALFWSDDSAIKLQFQGHICRFLWFCVLCGHNFLMQSTISSLNIKLNESLLLGSRWSTMFLKRGIFSFELTFHCYCYSFIIQLSHAFDTQIISCSLWMPQSIKSFLIQWRGRIIQADYEWLCDIVSWGNQSLLESHYHRIRFHSLTYVSVYIQHHPATWPVQV